jgi:hypothetical protein
LEKVILGDGGNGIEANNQPFTYFLNLKEVIFPKGLSTIPSRSFLNLQSLEKVTIPNSVTDLTIGNFAFNNCTSLASLTIPNSITDLTIGAGTFGSCTSLTSLTIPDGVANLTIGINAFRFCTNLTSLTIPNSVTNLTIDSSAFISCSKLTSLTIPDSVIRSIDPNAFCDSSLNLVTISDTASRTLKVYLYNEGTNNAGINMINSILEAAPPISDDDDYTFDLSSISPAITLNDLTQNSDTRWRVKLRDGVYEWNGLTWEQIE